MRTALCFVVIVVATSAIGTPAHAQNRPWCAFYDALYATNCSFSTYEQCLATVSGVGGYCEPNTMYVPPCRTGKALLARRHRHRVYR